MRGDAHGKDLLQAPLLRRLAFLAPDARDKGNPSRKGGLNRGLLPQYIFVSQVKSVRFYPLQNVTRLPIFFFRHQVLITYPERQQVRAKPLREKCLLFFVHLII